MKIDKSNINKYIKGTSLECQNKRVTSIEDIPDYITEICCWHNKLTSLPKLPDGLVYLSCVGNDLTSLPMLPIGLKDLWCYNNKLTSYPESYNDRQWMDRHNKLLNRINIINKLYENR